MKSKQLFKQIFLSPAFASVIIIMLFVGVPHWLFTRDSFWRPYGDRGKVYESQELSNGTFKVKVNAHYETGVYLGGAYYVLLSAPVGSDEWREFIWKRVDDPNPISEGMFRFVSDSIGYVSTGDKYAVTLDGGHSWRYWEVSKELPADWQYSYKYIKEVQVEPNGTGRMRFYPFPDKDVSVPELQTEDYGQHWNVVQDTAKSNNGMQRTRD